MFMYRLDLTFRKGELDAGGAAATMAAAGGYLVTAELSGLVLPIGAQPGAKTQKTVPADTRVLESPIASASTPSFVYR